MMDNHTPYSIRYARFPYDLIQEVSLIPRQCRISVKMFDV